MSKQARNYSDIALAIESILAGFGSPEVENVSIDPWEISLRTAELIPDIEYKVDAYNDYIISRAEIQHAGLTIGLSHVIRGKVVPA